MASTLTFLVALNLSLLVVIVVFLVRIRKYSAEINSGHAIDQDQIIARIDELSQKYDIQQEALVKELVDYKREVEEKTSEEVSNELYQLGLQAVLEAQKASTSFLQRKLGIGYSRAVCLMDMLEDEGVIGPEKGSKPRVVLRNSV